MKKFVYAFLVLSTVVLTVCSCQSDAGESVVKYCAAIDSAVVQLKNTPDDVCVEQIDRHLSTSFCNDSTVLTQRDKELLLQSLVQLSDALIDRKAGSTTYSEQQIREGKQKVASVIADKVEKSETLSQLIEALNNE